MDYRGYTTVSKLEYRRQVFEKLSKFIRPLVKERAMIAKNALLRIG
jgi:hypothetical protein